MGDADVVVETVIEQPRAKSEATKPVEHAATHAPTQPAAGMGTPITPGMIKVIRARLEGAGITEAELAKKFDHIEALTTANVNDVLAWLSNPS